MPTIQWCTISFARSSSPASSSRTTRQLGNDAVRRTSMRRSRTSTTLASSTSSRATIVRTSVSMWTRRSPKTSILAWAHSTDVRPRAWATGEANVGYYDSQQNYRSFYLIGCTNSSGSSSQGSILQQVDANRSYTTTLQLTATRNYLDLFRNVTKVAFRYEDQTF